MPAWLHERAEHILSKNPSMPKSEAFAIATQQSHALGKTPKSYGTVQGREIAKAKYKTPEDDKKTAMVVGLVDELEKIAFNTNQFSGPMNPTYMRMASYLPSSKIPIAQASRAGVAGTGGGSMPTRGGFLMASRQEAPVVPLKKQAEKPKILNGDHLQYLLDKERGDGVDRGKLKEKDSEGMDQNYWPYKPGDFKPAKLASHVMDALLAAYDRHIKLADGLTPQSSLQKAQSVGQTPNQMGNGGTSIREVALPKGLSSIANISHMPVAAVDKGGKI